MFKHFLLNKQTVHQRFHVKNFTELGHRKPSVIQVQD